MRKEFEMTQADMDLLMAASKPVPYLVAGGMGPRSQQEKANSEWESLGRKMGFGYMTVRPVPGRTDLFFTAESESCPDSDGIA